MHPDARDPRASTSRGSLLGVAPEAARHARGTACGRRARRPRRSRRASWPSSSTTSIAIPSAGPPTEHALIGPTGVGERKHAPTSVPPEQLMIGTREPPTFSASHRYGLGVPRLAGRHERAQRREVRRRIAVREQRPDERRREPERRDALVLDRRPEPMGVRPVGGALRETIVPPSAPTPTTVHGPMIQPMSVAKCMHVALVDVGLVGGFARDRDEEAALHMHARPWACRRPGGVGQEVRGLGVDLERRQVAWPVVELEGREQRPAPAEPDPRIASSTISSIGTLRPRREDSRRVITTFASLASSRWATAGAAKPEKIGTWTAPMCATAFDATATSGDIARKIATRSPASTPSATSSSASLRHVARELGERERAARAVLAEPDGGDALGTPLGPAMHAVAGDVELPADEPGRPFGAARAVEHRVPGLRELDPQVVDAEGPEPGRIVLRAADELVVVRGTRRAHEPGRVRVLDRRLVGRPNHVRHPGNPTCGA